MPKPKSPSKKLNLQDLPSLTQTLVDLATTLSQYDLLKVLMQLGEELTSKQSALQAAQESLANVRADHDQLQDRLTLEHEQSLKRRRAEQDKELEAVKAALDTVRADIGTSSTEYEEQQALIVAAKNELVATRNELTELNDKVIAATIQWANLKEDVDQLNVQLPPLTEQVSAANARLSELNDLTRVADSEYTAQKAEMERLDGEYAEKIAKYEHQVEVLKAQAIDLDEKRRVFEADTELIRRNLADRELKLDKWADNMTMRERKVNMDEDAVRRNAQLLDL